MSKCPGKKYRYINSKALLSFRKQQTTNNNNKNPGTVYRKETSALRINISFKNIQNKTKKKKTEPTAFLFVKHNVLFTDFSSVSSWELSSLPEYKIAYWNLKKYST